MTNNCFSKNPPEKKKKEFKIIVLQFISQFFKSYEARLILEGKLYSKNNPFLFTLCNSHGTSMLSGPLSVAFAFGNWFSNVVWTQVQFLSCSCMSCLCLKYSHRFCTSFDATPWINHGPFSSVNDPSSPANTEKAGMSLKKIDYIFPSILGNTDQLNIFKTQLKEVPCPSVSCLEVK